MTMLPTTHSLRHPLRLRKVEAEWYAVPLARWHQPESADHLQWAPSASFPGIRRAGRLQWSWSFWKLEVDQ